MVEDQTGQTNQAKNPRCFTFMYGKYYNFLTSIIADSRNLRLI